jgi:hypothetical protein
MQLRANLLIDPRLCFVTAFPFVVGYLMAMAPDAIATCVAPIVFSDSLDPRQVTGAGPSLTLMTKVERIKVVSTRASSTFFVCLEISDDESVIPGTHLQCAEESVDAYK